MGRSSCGPATTRVAGCTAHSPLMPAPSVRFLHAPQEVVQGRSLADMVRSGQRATEQEVCRVAGELLDVLQYLGSLRPPVIHRVRRYYTAWVGGSVGR